MKQGKGQTVAVARAELQQWSGPIPAPESLARYEQVVPGSAQTIINMAVKEQEHRHSSGDREAKRRYRTVVLSMVFALVCVLSLVGLVFYAVYKGSDNSALAAIITAIAAVAGVFGLKKLLVSKK